jgi:hypothetical protein
MDGFNWTGSSNMFSSNGRCIAYNSNQNMWIAGGYGATKLAYSVGAITWTEVGTGIFSNYSFGIAYSNTQDIWVAGGGATNSLAYSKDGFKWTGISGSTSLFSIVTWCVACSPTMWVAGGQGTTNSLAYSKDGVTWTGLSKNIISSNTMGITYSSKRDLWVAAGNGPSVPGNTLAYSKDGVTWTGSGKGVVYSEGDGVAYSTYLDIWVAVGGTGGNNIAYSSDAINWTGVDKTVFSTGQGAGVSYNNTQQLWSAAGSGVNSLAYSTNGINWTGRGTGMFSTGFCVACADSTAIPLMITQLSTTSFAVSWSFSGATAYTYYLNGTATTPAIDNGVASQSATFSGLTAGNRYSVYIKATTPGGAVWSITRPTDIAGCILWLDAADTSTVTQTSNAISSWKDKVQTTNFTPSTGSAAYTTVSATNPIRVISNSSANFLVNTSFAISTNYSIFAFGNDATNGFSRVIESHTDAYLFIGTANGSTNFFTIVGNGSSWNYSSNPPNLYSISNNSVFGMTNVISSTSGVFSYANGNLCNADSSTGFNGSQPGFTGLHVCGGIQGVSGNTGEVVIYNTVLSTTNRQYIEGYLAWKFGSQSALAAGHPYKTVSPTGLAVWNP